MTLLETLIHSLKDNLTVMQTLDERLKRIEDILTEKKPDPTKATRVTGKVSKS